MLREALPKIVTESLPGERAKAVIARRNSAIPSAIRCIYPVVIARGEGAMLEDVDGNRFLDWIGGVGVLNIGYTHPEVVEAVKEQADRYFHGMFNIVTHEGYVALAEKLCSIVPVQGEKKRAFFANSGAEANENAVKIAKAFTKRPNIIVFSGAFHGRTMLTMSMTAKKAYAKGMGPFPDGIYRAKFPYLYRKPEGLPTECELDYYLENLKSVFDEASPPEQVAAIVVEPLQGEGGFIPAPLPWVRALREICDQHGILLIADEVQTGFCRTGKMFASEYWKAEDAAPDILVTAKSIAGGLPLSAIVAREEIMESVPAGVIGGTYCGNPLACAAALKVIELMEREKLADRSAEIGRVARERFLSFKEKYPVVGDVRGLGGMLGLEFVTDQESRTPNAAFVNDLIQEALRRGLMIESAGAYGNVIRFLAPLVMTDEQLSAGLDILDDSIKAILKYLDIHANKMLVGV